jgi:hypothetical protein
VDISMIDSKLSIIPFSGTGFEDVVDPAGLA